MDLHDPVQRAAAIAAIEQQMRQAAANLEFEMAAMLRDQLNDLRSADAPNVKRPSRGWHGDDGSGRHGGRAPGGGFASRPHPPSGSVVWLVGALGAGKTTLVRAIARGRDVAASATSPTYALVHHYEAPTGAVYHVDCYRLRQAEEALDLDWATLMGADLLLIEWPERAGAWAPAPTHTITLTHAGAG